MMASAMRELVGEVRSELTRQGITFEQGFTSRHIYFRFTSKTGRPVQLICSKTASDHRTRRNTMSHLYRLIQYGAVKL